jgi:deoxyhypusine synthase
MIIINEKNGLAKIQSISNFIEKYMLHFNGANMVASAKSLKKHLDGGGKLIITLAGAFSTGECGKLLAQLIKEDKVHAISCTGANIEEDVFRLLGQSHYGFNLKYNDLTPQQEQEILDNDVNRVTDTIIPEKHVIDILYKGLDEVWFGEYERRKAKGKMWHEYFYELFSNNYIQENLDKDAVLEDSWLYQAALKNLPLCVPGNCDSTMGNVFAQLVMEEDIESWIIKHDSEYMVRMANWYIECCNNGQKLAMLTLGGGISADFPQTISPFVVKDLNHPNGAVWSHMTVVTMDMSVTAGGFSGCALNEKITWAKLGVDSDKFLINSDFSIVFPLIAAYLLEL